MSNSDDLDAAKTAGAIREPAFPVHEIPYLAILVLTVCGVGYVSMTRQPIFVYWELLALFIAAICIFAGWRRARDSQERWRVVWTQLLHWGAFLIAMSLVFFPSVQAIVNADAASLIILLLLALGTFVAGVHISSWRMCLNGAVMALSVPAIAWIDQAALIVTLVFIVVAAGATAFLWHRLHAVADQRPELR
jgi:hypothetical protein